ncbi:MAG: flagellar biosynthesis protein FlhA [Anaplasmataceae bacterium]|nr:flagellar biosynthesis protein FlhA [Anaplasmataceae bacterium]
MRDAIQGYFKLVSNYGEIIFALSVMIILSILLLPVASGMIDFLFAVSITISLLILISTIFIKKSLDFNSFPSVLLVVTMLRLSLNIASTRLILSQGHHGVSAAGKIIHSFGTFIMQGSLTIGVIIFIILTIINFIVITKGSGRIAEVSARFSLDAMPGKQMAIDADLSSGIIDEVNAKERRKELEAESSFFGAMDGASKFVRGDAIAGILIIFINFIAGILIGVLQANMKFHDALTTYTILTIGDGLVSQIPALIISIAAGLLVTKSSGVYNNDSQNIFSQFASDPKTIILTSVVIIAFGTLPGMPFLLFFVIAVFATSIAYLIWSTTQSDEKDSKAKEEGDKKNKAEKDGEIDNISDLLKVDPIKIVLGRELISIYQDIANGIKVMRKDIVKELGLILPLIRIQDDIALGKNSYEIRIKDVKYGGGEVYPEKFMILNTDGRNINIEGEDGIDPAFGVRVKWIEKSLSAQAENLGYAVVASNSAIIVHISEVIKDNVTEFITHNVTQQLLDNIGQENKKLVADLIPGKFSINVLKNVLQRLLNERISIKDMPLILEAMSEVVIPEKIDYNTILEYIRYNLMRQITAAITCADGFINILTLSPDWEREFFENINNNALTMNPDKIMSFLNKLKDIINRKELEGFDSIALVVSQGIRIFVYQVASKMDGSGIPIISQREIYHKAKIRNLGMV